MYSLSRAPSKLASRASNRGVSQQIETFEGRAEVKSADLNSHLLTNSAPKPVFRGKKYVKKQQFENKITLHAKDNHYNDTYHENVNLIAQEWLLIQKEITRNDSRGDKVRPRVYQSTKNSLLKDFVPFNIDEWWMNRTLHGKV